MQCDSRKKNDSILIKVSGRMDANTSADFEAVCEKWFEKGETKLIMDCDGLEYLSSAGLRSILCVGKKVKSQAGELRLCNLNGMVEEVMSISGFDTVFPIFDTLEAALEEE